MICFELKRPEDNFITKQRCFFITESLRFCSIDDSKSFNDNFGKKSIITHFEMIFSSAQTIFHPVKLCKKDQAFSKSNLSDGYAAGFQICTVCFVGHATDLIIEEKSVWKMKKVWWNFCLLLLLMMFMV